MRQIFGNSEVAQAIKLAAYIRAHSFPCRVVVGRKTGRVMLRAAMRVGYDTTKIKEASRRNWSIELVKPTAQAVRDWLEKVNQI